MPMRLSHAALTMLFLAAVAGTGLPNGKALAQYSAPSLYERYGDRPLDRRGAEDAYDEDLYDPYYDMGPRHDPRLSRYEDYPSGYHWFYRPYPHPRGVELGEGARHGADPWRRGDARDSRDVGLRPSASGLSERERIIRLLRIPLPEPRGGRKEVRRDSGPAEAKARPAPVAPAAASEAAGKPPAEGPSGSRQGVPAAAARSEPSPHPPAPPAAEPHRPQQEIETSQGVTVAAKAHTQDQEQRINTAGKGDPIHTPSASRAGAPESAVTPRKAAAGDASSAPPDDELTRMIGQMILAGFDGKTAADADVAEMQKLIASGRVGGFVLTKRNIASPEQVKALVAALRGVRSEHLVLAAVAQNGGEASPLAASLGFARYPSPGELGLSGDPLQAHTIYAGMASDLHALGFNVNIGPVADLAPGTGAADGTFGADPRHVTAFAKAFAIAHRDAGMFTVMKHFPGGADMRALDHGRIEEALAPYRDLARERFSDMVLVGHARHAEISLPLERPAALSPKAVQELLRSRLGYEGVTIAADVDAPQLDAVATFEDRVVMAVEAGNDMVLIGAPAPGSAAQSVLSAIHAIRTAVATGRLSQARIRTSFDRVRAMKRRLEKMQSTARAASAQRTTSSVGSESATR